MDAISLRARSVGEILDGAFRLYRQDLGLYVLTAVLAGLPMAISMVLTLGGSDPFWSGAMGFVFLLFALVAYVLAWAALMHQMNERLEGRQPELGSSVVRALRLCLRIVWAAFITYIVMTAGLMVVLIAAFAVGIGVSFVASELVTGFVAIAIGLALGLTFGLRVFAGSMLFLPGIIAEGMTGYASVKRGFELTKRGSFRIAGVVTVAWILIFVPVMAVYFVTGTTSMLWDPEAAMNGTIGMGQLAVQQFLTMIGSGFTTPFLVACVLLLYYDQRVRVEAFDLEAEAGALVD